MRSKPLLSDVEDEASSSISLFKFFFFFFFLLILFFSLHIVIRSVYPLCMSTYLLQLNEIKKNEFNHQLEVKIWLGGFILIQSPITTYYTYQSFSDYEVLTRCIYSYS